MPTVHVFASAGRFRSHDELREFVEQTYTHAGDPIPSRFATETGLVGYTPMCIECLHADQPGPVTELVRDASYADQWRYQLDATVQADAVVCVYEPNRVTDPRSASLAYLGGFRYDDGARRLSVPVAR